MCLKKKKTILLEQSTEKTNEKTNNKINDKVNDKIKNKLQEGNYLEWAYILRKQKRNNKKKSNSWNI